MRQDVRSEVDFVLTFEEMSGVFEARDVDLETIEEDPNGVNDVSVDGRNFAVAGGVANAVVNVVREIAPEREIPVANAEGAAPMPADAGRRGGGQVPRLPAGGDGLPGRLRGRRGHHAAIRKAASAVALYAKQADHSPATKTEYIEELGQAGRLTTGEKSGAEYPHRFFIRHRAAAGCIG